MLQCYHYDDMKQPHFCMAVEVQNLENRIVTISWVCAELGLYRGLRGFRHHGVETDFFILEGLQHQLLLVQELICNAFFECRTWTSLRNWPAKSLLAFDMQKTLKTVCGFQKALRREGKESQVFPFHPLFISVYKFNTALMPCVVWEGLINPTGYIIFH